MRKRTWLQDAGRSANESAHCLRHQPKLPDMKNESQYRFNLQFVARSADERRVGEFLSTLGRRKSAVIIAAVIDYLENHPELSFESSRIRVSTVSADQLETRIRAIIDEKLSVLPVKQTSTSEVSIDTDPSSTDIVDMLDDLELFNRL